MTIIGGFCIALLLISLVALLLYSFGAPITKPNLLGLGLSLYIVCELLGRVWGH